jgi:hypothetical protein
MQANIPGKSDPGEIIHERNLSGLYGWFMAQIQGLHEDVIFESTQVEVRAFFRQRLLCRLVPYRELFHVQIGEENPWEIRVRDNTTCIRTLDRVFDAFFELYASGGSSSSAAG